MAKFYDVDIFWKDGKSTKGVVSGITLHGNASAEKCFWGHTRIYTRCRPARVGGNSESAGVTVHSL